MLGCKVLTAALLAVSATAQTVDTQTGKNNEWVVAPLPIIDPTVGNGLALAGGYLTRLNREDTISPPSVFGALGLKTSNGTWAFAAAAQLFLKEDRYRLLAVVAKADIHYDYFGIGNESGFAGDAIPILQTGGGILVGGQVRVAERWYAGSRYYNFRVDTALDDAGDKTDLPIEEVKFRLPVAALAMHISRDSRDSQFNPTRGTLFDTKVYFSNPAVGARYTYRDTGVSFQQYLRLGERQTLAYRAKACAVGGVAPFFALCTLGRASDLRGYPAGRYRDARMLTGQVEYRREVWWRFGMVAFAGAGQVAKTFGDFKFSNTRPSLGGGLRFMVAKKNKINLRVDYAEGQNSHGWYVGVGEAF